MKLSSLLLFLLSQIFTSAAFAQAAPERHVWQDKRMFQPMSRTAQSITGPIRLSGNPDFARKGSKMRIFLAGKRVNLTSVGASFRDWDSTASDPITAEVFSMASDPGKLVNGNFLCGDPVRDPARYIVFHESWLGEKLLLGMAVFKSRKPPHDINSPGLCGTYGFYAD